MKPQYQVNPVRTAVKKATVIPPHSLWYKGHQKISETEKENTAVEAAHKNEQRAESLVKNGYRKWSYDRKNKPYNNVIKMEKRLQKANTKYHMTKFSVENKNEKTNKKWFQKHNIKKKYAQMARQKQNQETVRTAKDVFVQIVRAISHVAGTQNSDWYDCCDGCAFYIVKFCTWFLFCNVFWCSNVHICSSLYGK